ncbi:MAG: Glutathione transport system permease protein GsiD [Paracidovorax wautersii]|uniref:Glutathione transport system permease protein GsiD n=1 Tax=Paracidovorax wautersii TaxID=1177982 RepID=A0A7V8FMK9_9BURK|nr:MAG: Glutathione transport system permease protein GsiD [Paracidovorax wautersii]
MADPLRLASVRRLGAPWRPATWLAWLPRRPGDLAAVGLLLLIALAAIAPGWLTPYDPLLPDPSATLAPPSWVHPFGTDYLGRDLLARLIHGTGRTIAGSMVAVVIGLGAGIVLGLIAAYFGGWVDAVVGRAIDVLLAIPGLLLSMVIVVSLGFGTFNTAVAVGVSSVAVFTRLIRSEVLTIKELSFVEASRHLGQSEWRVLWRHILPNSYAAVLTLAALQFGSAILWISALSFLGYGAPPPEPEWGLLVAEGCEYVVSSPWMVVLPGLVIVATVVAIGRVSRLLRDNLG